MNASDQQNTDKKQGMRARITQKLQESLAPEYLEVINESHLHAGHMGDDGSGESHWRVIIQSPHFDSLSRLERERAVHRALVDEMPLIHALSVTIKT